MTAIHQFLPTLAGRDAISGHALQIQCTLREHGIDSEIYVRDAHPDVRNLTRPYDRFRGSSSNHTWLLYQASTGSKMVDWLIERPEPLIVNYHNVTPVEFFAGWEPGVAAELKLGRKQLKRLVPSTELLIADSAFNESEAATLGYTRTAVVPILFDHATFDGDVDAGVLTQLRDAKGPGGADLLFVGRLAPNKAQHDLLKAFACYRKVYDPLARLRLVGASSSHAYSDTLHRYARGLGLVDAVDFTGSLSGSALRAYYETADLFVSASDHEGFCVPILEALHARVPVVAYAAAAVPETVGDAGVLARSKEPAALAAAWWRVLSDPALRARLVDAGVLRAAEFDLEHSKAKLLAAVDGLVEANV